MFWNENSTAASQVLGHCLGLLPGLPHRLAGCDLFLKLGLLSLPRLNPQSTARPSCITDLNSRLLVGFCSCPPLPYSAHLQKLLIACTPINVVSVCAPVSSNRPRALGGRGCVICVPPCPVLCMESCVSR